MHFNASKIECKPVVNFDAFTTDNYPDLYGTQEYMLCHAFVNKLHDFIYILRPSKNTLQCRRTHSVDMLVYSLVDTVIMSTE